MGASHRTHKLIFVERTDPEFNFMFSHFVDPVMRNELYLESLQYMGTVLEVNSGRIFHEFRHRAVPGTNERKLWQIEASPNFKARAAALFAPVEAVTFTF